MNSIDMLKSKRNHCEEEDLCFNCGVFLKAPKEVFHKSIGFVTIGEECAKQQFNILEDYENKYQNKTKQPIP